MTTEVQAGPAFRLAVALIKPWALAFTRRRWSGAENIPAGGVVVVTNHISHLDPFTFAHFLWENGRPVRFLAKESVFRIPVLGRIVSGARQIPVYRESDTAADALRDAVDAVRRGECIGIYPEGTLTRDPDLWPMRGKTGAARIALTTGCPVVPVAQWGVQEMLPPYGGRPRLLPRTTVAVSAGRPVELDDLQGKPLTTELLTTATDRIMADLTHELEALRGERAPAVRLDPRAAGLPTIGRWRPPPPAGGSGTGSVAQ